MHFHLYSIAEDLQGLKEIFGLRSIGLIDKLNKVYGAYGCPNPKAPYPQNYIIDKEGKVRYWETEFNIQKSITVIERCLKQVVPVTVKVRPESRNLPPGSILTYTLHFQNNTVDPQDFFCMIEEILPDSSRATLWHPRPLHLDAGSPMTLKVEETIPGTMPPGEYSLIVKVGTFQSDAWDVDGFNFLVE